MKSHLEVAKDAVRSAGLEELADALEWAAAAVKHRSTLLSAARWAATADGGECPDCGHRSVHDRKCPTAEALHALDQQWSRDEVESAHHEAIWQPNEGRRPALGGSLIPPRPAFDPAFEAEMERRFGWRSRSLGVTVPQSVMLTMGSIAHADSPQPAQPQPEDEPADE